MTMYKVEYSILRQYVAEIDIPDAIHPTKRHDFVKFHIDSMKNEREVGASDYMICRLSDDNGWQARDR